MLQNWDTIKNINFPFGTNGKLMVLGFPILKHIVADLLEGYCHNRKSQKLSSFVKLEKNGGVPILHNP